MKKIITRLFCHHKYVMEGDPYLYDSGRTKRANYVCSKCGKLNNFDIFTVPERKLLKQNKGE